jgi:purine-binding chemotaxis protein CheW
MTREAMAPRPGQDRSPPIAMNADESGRTSWLLCRAAAILCALPLEHVIEIMRALPLEQLAGTPRYVRGLSIVRGVPVPVVDVGLIIGGQAAQSSRLIAVRAATRMIALGVDAVMGIAAIAADAFGEMPPLLQDTAADTIGAIGARDSDFLVVLRTARLVPDDVLAKLDAGATAP